MSVMSLFSKKTKPASEVKMEAMTGFFGKLPVRPDFVRHQTGNPAVKSLDQWIHEGIAYLVRRYPSEWKEKITSFPAINFYVAGENSGAVVSGVIQPSQDNTGRRHPIVNFSILGGMNPTALLPLVPFHFDKFYFAAGVLGKSASESIPLDSFTQKNNSLLSEMPDLKNSDCSQRMTEINSSTTMNDFWNEVLPDFSTEKRVIYIRDVIQTLRLAANRGPLRTAWGVRFPLNINGPRSTAVSFWLSLITSFIGDGKWYPHVFWAENGGGSMAALTVYFRAPGASSFAQLICPECDEGGVVDLVRRPLENMPEITDQNITSLASSQTMTIGDGIRAWSSAGGRS